jgi:hypothetical protein
VALQVGAIALRTLAGQALDLRHRLPRLWEATRALLVEPWVAQKIATMTRPLTAEQARLVDAAVVEAIEESPGRMLAIAEAKTIEADLDGYQVAQLALGAYRWVTPHGLGRIVTPRGTRKVDLIRGPDNQVIGEIYPGYALDYRPRT